MKNKSNNKMEFTFKGFFNYWFRFWKVTLLLFVIGLAAGGVFVLREKDSYTSDVTISVYHPDYSVGMASSPYSALAALFVSSEALEEIEHNSGDEIEASAVTITESPRSIFTISVVDEDADKARRAADALANNASGIIRKVYSDGEKYEVAIINEASDAVSTVTTTDKVISVVLGGLAAVLLVMVVVFVKFDLTAAKKD